jgi:hypothetical protein
MAELPDIAAAVNLIAATAKLPAIAAYTALSGSAISQPSCISRADLCVRLS